METNPETASDRFTLFSAQPWLQRLLFILILFLLPLAYLVNQAFLDQDSSLLPIEKQAKWVFHPVQKIEDAFHRPVSSPVKFFLEFELNEEDLCIEELELRVMAFRKILALHLNGRELMLVQDREWRDGSRAFLTGLVSGENLLEIIVANPEGIPGLSVEEPPILRTPGRWKAHLEGADSKPRKVVRAQRTGPPEPLDAMVGKDPGPLMEWLRDRGLSGLVTGWLVVWSFFLALVAIQLTRGKLAVERSAKEWGGKYSTLLSLVVLCIGFAVNISNAIRLPPDASPFDFPQHVEYIRYISKVGWVADPTQGFQMYQPPLYYWVASWIAGGEEGSLKGLQFLGALAGSMIAFLAWLLARRLLPERGICQIVAALFAVSLPMLIYMAPLVTNEVFSAAMIAMAFHWLVRSADDRHPCWKTLLAGVLIGLAMLSKFPALFILTGGCLWFLQRWFVQSDKRSKQKLMIYLGSAVLICGWFYTRNVVQFGDPFVKAGDPSSGHWYVQQPTYRTVDFYYTFGRVFFHHPERAPWISFADGHYGSFWGDLFRVLLPGGDEPAVFWLSLVLVLAFPVSCAVLLGFLVLLRSAWQQPLGNVDLLLLAVPVWTFSALVSYSIELPFVSVIKAFFFLFLVPILAICLAQGRLVFFRFFRPLGWTHDVSFFLVCGISLWLYSPLAA